MISLRIDSRLLAFIVATICFPLAVADSSPPDEPRDEAEVVVSAPEPKYVAPTLRDRIGRIWAPVYIEGRGPLRLVLDT